VRPEEPRWVICIVDDDDSVRKGFARLMQSAGFEARAYGDAESFLAALPAERRVCILLDITMPRMSGLELYAQLKARGIRFPVIAVSARDDDVARSTAGLLGAAFFLRKPVDDEALLDAIEQVTRAPRR
jgi:FixJ family two-component response regulator